MKKITVYDMCLVEKIEETIKDICFIVVDKSEFEAEITDEYYQEIKKDLFNTLNETGYTQYDYIIEPV